MGKKSKKSYELSSRSLDALADSNRFRFSQRIHWKPCCVAADECRGVRIGYNVPIRIQLQFRRRNTGKSETELSGGNGSECAGERTGGRWE